VRNGDTFFDRLPEDWNIAKIGTTFDIKQGKSLSSRKQTGAFLKPFLRTSNVLWGRLDLSHLDEMDFTDDERKALTLEYGDLLVCEGGDIGRTAIWRNEKQECYYQNHLHRLRVKDEMIEPLFIMYWMQVALTQLGLYEGFGNKTTIPNLSSSRLKEFTVPAPEKKEQRKIAAVLSKIQKAIEIQESIIERTRELKKSTLHHVFTHGLRGGKTKETEIGSIPKSWDLRDLESVLKLAQYGLSVRGLSNGQYPILRMNCQIDGQVHFNDLQYVNLDNETFEKFKMDDRDILFNRTNSWELVGRTAIYHSKEPAVFASYLIRLKLDEKEINPDFVDYFFNMESTQKRLKSLASRGVSQSNISASKLKTFQIPVPALDEQLEIIKMFRTVDQKINLHTARKSSLQDLFKTMLDKLMTGEIRVKDLDIDVSEVSV
jgi:type I restriction enzyme S subunit